MGATLPVRVALVPQLQPRFVNERRGLQRVVLPLSFEIAARHTWSRFEGNFDLDYSPASSNVTVYNTSSFIQEGPGTKVEDPNRFGPLFEDRPHVFKVFGSYSLTGRVAVSSYLRIQSGTPWAARATGKAGC
jgi:hypothetical protein